MAQDTRTETVDQAYADAQIAADALLREVAEMLDGHAETAYADTGPNWGHVGDIRQLITLLQRARAAL
jgi:hypothetical protein